MTTTPGIYPITIYKGATYSKIFTWKNPAGTAVDLTTFTARMQAREKVTSTTTFIDISTTSGITLGGTNGTITVTLTAAETAAITATSGVYDLELIDAASVITRLLNGTVTISEEVTR